MSDKTPNADYEYYYPKWKRIRDVMEGRDAVIAEGETYLPRLSEQTDDDYDAYKARAVFLEATAKTEMAFRGLLFRTPVNVEDADNETVADMIADIDLEDTDIDTFASVVASEVMQTNRYLCVVNLADGITQRPYLETWKAEQLLDWDTARINGSKTLSYVKLYEGYVDAGDGEARETIRELRLDPSNADGTTYAYVVERFQRVEVRNAQGRRTGKSEWQSLGIETPIKRGEPWPYIPCYLFGPRRGYDCAKPPLLGLADLNLSHYRTSADLEHGAHYTALPMPWIAGVEANPGERFTIGASQAWVFENPQAKAEYLEFKGEGLGFLERNLDRKQAMMAAEGARMLAPEKSSPESGFALQLRQGSEFASLNTIAHNISHGLSVLLLYMVDWAGVEVEPIATVNTDFENVMLGAQEITALLAAWQGGAISLETFLFNMRRGKRIDDQRTIDDEILAIESENQGSRGMDEPAAPDNSGSQDDLV